MSVDDEENVDRNPALVVVPVDGGTIRVHLVEEKEQLFAKAVCDCGHRNCTLQRTMLPGKDGNPRARGRPIGHLLAWLAAGHDPHITSRKKHKRVKPDYQTRKDKRERFMMTEAAQELLELERAKWPNEGDEPRGLP